MTSGHKGIKILNPPEKYGITAYAVVPAQTWNTPTNIITNLGLRLWVEGNSCEAFLYEPAYTDHSRRVWCLGYAIDSLPFFYQVSEELVVGERVYISMEMRRDGSWQIHYGIPRLKKDYYQALSDEKFKGKPAREYGASLEGAFNCYGDLGLNSGFSILYIALIQEPVYPVKVVNIGRQHQIVYYGGEEEVLGVLLEKNNLYIKPCTPRFTMEE
jgi:hypothetical protein